MCVDCPAGHYAPNGTVCIACDDNRILSESRDSCAGVCDAGSTPSKPDHLSCTPCPTGQFAPFEGAASCHPCSKGTFAGTRGSISCEPCLVGQFGDEQGLSQCSTCPTDRTTLGVGAASYLDCVCVENTYADTLVYERDTLTCLPCADRGMVCREGRMPTPEAGFWHDPRDDFDVMFPCEPPEACTGRDLYGTEVHAPCGLVAAENSSDAAVHAVCGTHDPLILDAEEGCATGFRGTRCSMCDTGFYRLNGICEQCPETEWIMVLLVGITLVVVAAAAAFIVRSGISLAPLTIGMDYFQTLSRISSIRADWSSVSEDMLSLTRVFELDVEMTAPECFVETSFTQTWTAVMAMPFLLTGLLVTAHILLFLISVARTKSIRVPVADIRSSEEKSGSQGAGVGVDMVQIVEAPRRTQSRPGSVANSPSRIAPVPPGVTDTRNRRLTRWEIAKLAALLNARRLGAELLLLLQVLYVQLSVKVLTAIDCTILPNGQQALDASPDIICWQGEHTQLAARAGIAIAGYVLGIPMLFAAVLSRLVRLRRRLRARYAGNEGAAGLPKISHRLPASLRQFAVHYMQQDQLERRTESTEQVASSLFKRFRAENTRWILIIVLRKVLLAAVTVLSSSRPGVQLALFAGVLFCAMLAQIHKSPYARLDPNVPDAVHLRTNGGLSTLKPLRKLRGKKAPVSAGRGGVGRGGVGRSFRATAREAVKDPNVMEQTSIVASLAVVLAAMLYYTGSTAAKDGHPLDPNAVVLLDVTLVAVVAAVSLYMVALLVFPLLTICVQRVQGRHVKKRVGSNFGVETPPGCRSPRQGQGRSQGRSQAARATSKVPPTRRGWSPGRRPGQERGQGTNAAAISTVQFGPVNPPSTITQRPSRQSGAHTGMIPPRVMEAKPL